MTPRPTALSVEQRREVIVVVEQVMVAMIKQVVGDDPEAIQDEVGKILEVISDDNDPEFR